MRKSLALTTLALGATLALTACGGAAGSSPSAPTVEPVKAESATPTPTKDSSKSSRGNIVKEFGQGANITDTLHGDKEIVNFSINSIAPGTCTEQYAQAPTNGNIVIVDVSAETKPELADAIMKSFTLSGYDFKYIADNGTTFNGNLASTATYSCIPAAETFPSAGMGPGEKITAKVVLDVPAAHGILVLKAPGSNTVGWEYKF